MSSSVYSVAPPPLLLYFEIHPGRPQSFRRCDVILLFEEIAFLGS